MPIPLLVPALASLAGAVLSDELEERPPRWTVDVKDDVFDCVGTKATGFLVVDFRSRTVSAVWMFVGHGEVEEDGTTWVFRVEDPLVGSDLRSWVEERLPFLEGARKGVLESFATETKDAFSRDLESDTWGPIRVRCSASSILQNASDELGPRFVFEMLKDKGISQFFDGYSETSFVTGTPRQKAKAVLAWAKARVEEALVDDGRVQDIPAEELELLLGIGNIVGGFDVVIDGPDDTEMWMDEDVSRFQLVPDRNSEEVEVLRWTVRP